MKKSAVMASVAVVAAGITLLGGLGIASAMSSRPGESVKPARDRDACFDANFIRGFQTPSDHKLIIISDRNQAYELTLGGPCWGLDTSMAIGVRTRGVSEVCGPFDADIVFRDSMGGQRLQQCRVVDVRHLQGAEADEYVDKPMKKSEARSGASGSAASNW